MTKHPIPITYKQEQQQLPSAAMNDIMEEMKDLASSVSQLDNVKFARYCIGMLDVYTAQAFRHKSKDKLVKRTIFDIAKQFNEQQKQ
jgi:hypothetical protein|nr:MAG TPA: hypothetical protein [Caudoviricetes sp.]